MYAMYTISKRTLDIVVSSTALILLFPLLLVVGLLVRRKLGSPVIFRQIRIGKNNRPFTLLKFRSLQNLTDADGEFLSDEKRATRFGLGLRSTSIDELPSLWCVLIGDMSLVGPRPLLPEYLPLYSTEQAKRHEVKPGVTGWPNVNGRNSLSWEEKFGMDTWYVENRSFLLDMKILILTLRTVVSRKGIAADGQVSGKPFLGSEGGG